MEQIWSWAMKCMTTLSNFEMFAYYLLGKKHIIHSVVFSKRDTGEKNRNAADWLLHPDRLPVIFSCKAMAFFKVRKNIFAFKTR
jgi:hypothetical protein